MTDLELELHDGTRGGERRVRDWIPFWEVNSLVNWMNMVGDGVENMIQNEVKSLVNMILDEHGSEQ